MRIDLYLKQLSSLLIDSGVPTARLDSLLLIEFVTGIDRAKILAHPELELNSKQKLRLDKLVQMRKRHIPIAQIVKKCEFYGRQFYINKHVLQPRPESEMMIDLLKELVHSDLKLRRKLRNGNATNAIKDLTKVITIADIGTGSGALGITAKLELVNVVVDLVDIDSKTLKVAQKNVDLHTINLRVILNDLVMGLKPKYDIMLCNLPYVPDEFKLNQSAEHEPKLAIFGGLDGLDVYRRFFKQLLKLHHKPLYLLTECFPENQHNLSTIALSHGYICRATNSFVQIFQVAK